MGKKGYKMNHGRSTEMSYAELVKWLDFCFGTAHQLPRSSQQKTDHKNHQPDKIEPKSQSHMEAFIVIKRN